MYQLPHDTALEANLIGCMIYDPQCIGEVIDVAKPTYFYHKQYGALCKKIYELWAEDEKQVDIVILSPFLEKIGLSVSEVTDMVSGVATTASVRYSAERLRDLAALRAAVRVGQELVESTPLRDSNDIRKAIVGAESKLSRITETTVEIDSLSSIEDAVEEFSRDFEEARNNNTGITGIASGLTDLDLMTAGFQKQDLIIIAARPSMGKTALALQLALNISNDLKEPTLFFSLEMAKRALVRRMIASQGKIDLQRLNTGLISKDDYQKYLAAKKHISRANLVIDDQSGMTIPEMKAKARRMQRERGLSCIIVDYLQFIQGERGLSRFDLVSDNTRQLKNLAREFDVPVICLSQLSRGVEQREDKRPLLSDLRESGEIEQTADVVLFLYRDEYYNQETEAKNIAELIIGKQRNGPTGKIELAFFKEYNWFGSLTRNGGENEIKTDRERGTVSGIS